MQSWANQDPKIGSAVVFSLNKFCCMVKQYWAFLFFFVMSACTATRQTTQKLPAQFMGEFVDDYGIEYQISDRLFWQKPGSRYHILEWNVKDQYIIAQNDVNNPSDSLLFTKIDYMVFKDMNPYEWGFCYTVYKAFSKEEALQAVGANRNNPINGCNGYPFSRLKRK